MYPARTIFSYSSKSDISMITQVGPGDDYVLTVGGFNTTLSTLKDMNNDGHVSWNANGMKFSTK